MMENRPQLDLTCSAGTADKRRKIVRTEKCQAEYRTWQMVPAEYNKGDRPTVQNRTDKASWIPHKTEYHKESWKETETSGNRYLVSASWIPHDSWQDTCRNKQGQGQLTRASTQLEPTSVSWTSHIQDSCQATDHSGNKQAPAEFHTGYMTRDRPQLEPTNVSWIE